MASNEKAQYNTWMLVNSKRIDAIGSLHVIFQVDTNLFDGKPSLKNYLDEYCGREQNTYGK